MPVYHVRHTCKIYKENDTHQTILRRQLEEKEMSQNEFQKKYANHLKRLQQYKLLLSFAARQKKEKEKKG